MPPPSVRPPTPTEPVSPSPIASPCAWAAVRQLAGGQSRLRPGDPLVRVYLERLHPREVEHDPAVADAVPGGAVSAAPNRELEPLVLREPDDGRDLVRVPRPEDRCGSAIDLRQEDLPRALVVGVVRRDGLACELGAQPLD